MRDVRRILEVDSRQLRAGLIDLLRDSVENGASVGFLPPLTSETNTAYWEDTLKEVKDGKRILLVTEHEDRIVGSVQLDLAAKQNALHRAEVQKLLVHTDYRRQGLGKELMSAVEDIARELGRILLVLDTLEGDAGERLYQRCGYSRVGVIPRYASLSDGSLHGTVIFYKLLSD